MNTLQKTGATAPVVFTTATDKIAGILSHRLQPFPELGPYDQRNSSARIVLMQSQAFTPTEFLEILEAIKAIFAQRALEESLLSELQTKS